MITRAVRLVAAGCAATLCVLLAQPSGAGPTGTAEQPLPGAGKPRSESAVAVDPRDPRRVVVTVIEAEASHLEPKYYVTVGHAPRTRVYVSSDGGATYAGGGALAGPSGARSLTADGTLAWDPRGPLYVGYLAYKGGRGGDPGRPDRGRLGGQVGRRRAQLAGIGRRPRGLHARGRLPVRGQAGDHGRPARRGVRGLAHPRRERLPGLGGRADAAGVVALDRRRPHLVEAASAVDPGAGFGVTPVALPDGGVVFAYLSDRPSARTGPECGGAEWTPLVAARLSPDGRVSSGQVVADVCASAGVTHNGTAYGVHHLPTIAYDPATRSVVVAVTDARPGDEGLATATSRDGGRTWSRGRIAAEPGFALTHPQLAAAPGAVGLSYLASGPGGVYTPTLRGSRDGGRSWSAPVALSSVPSLGAQRPWTAADALTVGHYQGLAVGKDGMAHAAWPDLRPRERPHDVETYVRAVPLPR